MTPARSGREASLRGLLILGGCLTSSAFLAVLMSDDQMAAVHRWLGLGEFPEGTLTGYLARTTSALYAFHGLLLFALAADPRRHRPVIRILAWGNIAFGATLFGIHLHADLPAWWTATEGPSVIALGLLIHWLLGGVPKHRSA